MQLQRSSWVPNYPKLSVLIYRRALSAAAGSKSFEHLFASNGWSGIWRNGIFTYDHYHSGAHEVLEAGW
ncbi:cupin, partial [Rhizobium brockwellii]